MQQSPSETNSFITIEHSDDFYRELTPIDVDQALYTLKMTRKLTDNETSSKQECDCCRLIRTNHSSRLLLPLARRGRPYNSTRSNRLLCSNCQKIKHQQQIDILKTEEKFPTNQLYQTIINFDLSSDEQIALNNHQYQSTQMLVWKINPSDENTINLSYDTDSLTNNEKKILLEETIKKLQIILNNRSIIDHNQDNIDFTYRTLQTTINILSSSHNFI